MDRVRHCILILDTITREMLRANWKSSARAVAYMAPFAVPNTNGRHPIATPEMGASPYCPTDHESPCSSASLAKKP